MGCWYPGPDVGGWPAAALDVSQGIHSEGKLAHQEYRSFDSMWNLDPSKLAENAGFDPNRDGGVFIKGGESNTDPLTFLVGPAVVHYGNKETVKTVNLARYIDRKNKVVTSNTGEIVMNYGAGVALIDTPKAQAVTGFFGKYGTVQLRDVTIVSKDDYVTIMVVKVLMAKR